MLFDYTLIRSKRKSVAIQVDADCNIIVRAPLRLSQKEIDKAQSDMMSNLRKIQGQKISEQDLNKMIKKVIDEAKNSSNNQ